MLAVPFFQGCASSPWESQFVFSGVAAPAPATPPDAEIRLREVPWERLQSTLQALQTEIAASDTHPDDWSAERKLQAKAKLLVGLQIGADPQTVDVLGRSEFRTTDNLRPDDGPLAAFGRRLGATTIVWSNSYLGQTQVVRSEPVTEHRTGSYDRWQGGRRRSQTFNESSTIFVPITVTADEHAWVAYFLREQQPASAASPVQP